MVDSKIILNGAERFQKEFTLDKAKLVHAVEVAADKLEARYKAHGTQIPYSSTENFKYHDFGINKDWTAGLYSGCFWLAYELTGNDFFKKAAEAQLETFQERFDTKTAIDDHDVGFVFSPSAVAAYKLTGSEKARKLALDATEYFYTHSYSKEGKFIIRSWKTWDKGTGCRTMMDSLMNAPILFWATKETGDTKYAEAAIDHVKTTNNLLIRADASSCHHYQFDPKTAAPVGQVTWQGNRDESCWSRGHSWGIYGFPIAYAYAKEALGFIPDLHRDITYYMLNHLPEDLIPYWDYDFISGDEPRDSSAAAIAVCGMNEMVKALPDSAEQKKLFANASAMMLDSLIDNYANDIGTEYEGLVHHVTHAKPQGRGINECAAYGDYFYLEALLRFMKPDFKMYW